MTERILDRNRPIVDEFRTNDGVVGGAFAGHPILLLHDRGSHSGVENVHPVTYLPGDDGVLYVFGTAGGRPADPQWVHNLRATRQAKVEVGTDRYPVTATELVGSDREQVYARQVDVWPVFGNYARDLAGVRTVPVIELRRR